MFAIKTVHIDRAYGANDPYTCRVNAYRRDTNFEFKIELTDEQVLKVIDLISDEILAATTAQLASFRDDARMLIENKQPLIEGNT